MIDRSREINSESAGSRQRLMPLILTVRQRNLLHNLLHRDLRKCSTSALDACQRSGWSHGAGGGYELTAEGRLIAESSESAPADQELKVEHV
jgi:hypothetical protein